MNTKQNQKIHTVEALTVSASYTAEELEKNPNDLDLIPVFSCAVQCGLFGIQDDHIESYLSLDEYFIRNKHSTFIFKMEGDSMRPNIFPGDYLIVDRAISNFLNKIVVVDIFDERMCKCLVRENGQTILRSFNPKYKDLIVTEEMDMRIFGVATLCFRDLVIGM